MLKSVLYQRECSAVHLLEKDCELRVWGAVSHCNCVACRHMCGESLFIECLDTVFSQHTGAWKQATSTYLDYNDSLNSYSAVLKWISTVCATISELITPYRIHWLYSAFCMYSTFVSHSLDILRTIITFVWVTMLNKPITQQQNKLILISAFCMNTDHRELYPGYCTQGWVVLVYAGLHPCF
jgi:hypothetical protein